MSSIKTVAMKIKRVDKELSTLSKYHIRKESLDLMNDYIKTLGERDAAVVFLNHPKPTNMEDTLTSKLEYACGYIDYVDDDYIYCRIFEDKVKYIDLDTMRATGVYLMSKDDDGEKHLRHLCRINITIPK